MTSTKLNMDDPTLLVTNEVIDRLASVDGVADVESYGDQEKVFRVDADRRKFASRGLTIGDLTTALSNAAPGRSGRSAEEPDAGHRGARATATPQTPQDFANVIQQDLVTAMATATLGPRDGQTALRSNGVPGIGLEVSSARRNPIR